MVGRQQRGYQAVTAAPDNALLPACGANFSLQLETAANLLHMRAARRLAWGASGTGRVKASAAVKCRPACSGEGPSRVQPLAAHDRCSGMPIGAAGGAGKDGRPQVGGQLGGSGGSAATHHNAKSSVAGIPTGRERACSSATSPPATLQCRASTKVAHPAHVRKTAPRRLRGCVADDELQRPRRQAYDHAAGR